MNQSLVPSPATKTFTADMPKLQTTADPTHVWGYMTLNIITYSHPRLLNAPGFANAIHEKFAKVVQALGIASEAQLSKTKIYPPETRSEHVPVIGEIWNLRI